MKNIIKFLFLLIFAANSIWAQTWNYLGPSDFEDISDGTVGEMTIAANTNTGVLFAAYADATVSNKLTVKRFENGQWTVCGIKGISSSTITYLDAKVDNLGNLYVAYSDAGFSNKATVQKWNGIAWTTIGGLGFTNAQADYISIDFNSSNVPHIVFQDYSQSFKATVMSWNGTIWNNVGTQGFTTNAVSSPKIAFNSNNFAFVVFKDNNSSKLSCMYYNGAAWINVGIPDFTSGQVQTSGIDFKINPLNQFPTVIFSDLAFSNKSTVLQFNGSGWVGVGSAGFSPSATTFNTLAIKINGEIYASFRNQGGDTNHWVMSFTGTNWTTFAGSNFVSSNGSSYNKLIIGKDQNLFGGYNDGVSGKIIVKQSDSYDWAKQINYGLETNFINGLQSVSKNGVVYNCFWKNNALYVSTIIGTSFGYLQGMPIFTSTSPWFENLAIAIGNDNLPVVTGVDASTKIKVFKYNGASWSDLNSTSISETNCDKLAIEIGTDNLPVIIYTNGVFFIKKYNGSSWNSIGTNPFEWNTWSDFTIDNSNNIYLTSAELSNNAIFVKKWNGLIWSTIGTNLCNERLNTLDIKTDNNNEPILQCRNILTSDLKILKFNGGSWSNIGSFTNQNWEHDLLPLPNGDILQVNPFNNLRYYKSGTWTTLGFNANATDGLYPYLHNLIYDNGKVTVTYHNGGLFAQTYQLFNPTIPVTSATLSGLNTISTAGGTITLTSSFSPSNANSNTILGWTVSNNSIATISGTTGVLTAFTDGILTVSGCYGGVCAIQVVTITNQCLFPNLTQGLVAYYPFDGDANDYSGNSRNGTINGVNLTSNRFGENKKAYNFDGIDDKIVTGLKPGTISAYSICAWIKTNSPVGAPFICNRGTNFDGTISTTLLYNGSSKLNFFIDYDLTNVGIASTQSVNDNIWHHVVGTWQTSSGNQINSNHIKLYIDGALVSSYTSDNFGTVFSPINSPNNIVIGTYNLNGTVWAYEFNGELDDIYFYNRALTDAEIQALYLESSKSVCQGSNFAFAAPTISGATISWSGPNGFTSTAFSNTITGIQLNQAGTYTGIYSKNGCTSAPYLVVVTVNSNLIPVTSATLLGLNTISTVGGSITLTSAFSPSNANTNTLLGWTVSNNSIATISGTTGVLTAFTDGIVTVSGCYGGVCAIQVVTITNQCLFPNLTNGLVAYYPFDGNANDYSGNGYNGTVFGAINSVNRRNLSNSSFYFDGETNYFQTPINSGITNQVTYSVWFNTTTQFIGRDPGLINQRNSTFNVNGLSLTNNGRPVFYIDDNGGNSTNITAPSSYNNGNWHFVLGVYDGSVMKLFVDGVLIGTQNLNAIIQSSSQYRLGHDDEPTAIYSTRRFFEGSIDDIRIFNRALTDAEVQALYLESSKSVCQGSNFTFAAPTISGATIAWSHPNGFTSTAFSNTITGIQLNQAGTYTGIYTKNGCTSAPYLVVVSVSGATAIVTHPVSQTICQNASTALSVSATGTNLTYLWNTGASTAIINTSITGNYVVTVSGQCGSLVSNTANISTIVGTSITGMSTSQTICGASSTILSVAGAGSGLSYMWSNSQTSSSFTTSVSGTYNVTVSGSCGTVVGTAFTILFQPNVNIITQPISQSICQNSSTALAVSATGTNLSYLWSTGASTSSINTSLAGVYQVTVSGVCGLVVSNAVTISTILGTRITGMSTSQTICGNSVTLSVSGIGQALTYLWSNGNTNSSFLANSSGSCQVTVSGTCGVAVGSAFNLALIPNTQIVTQPQNTSFFSGSSATVSVSALGANLTYLWSNGAVTPAINVSIAGAYQVTVSGTCGVVISNQAIVTEQFINLPQTILGLNPISNKTYGDAPILLGNITATSGLPVSVSVVSNPPTNVVSYANNQINILGGGTVTVTAVQLGSLPTYLPANSVSQQFSIAKVPLTVSSINATRAYNTSNPQFLANFSGFINSDGVSSLDISPAVSTTAIQSSDVGTYPITIFGGSDNAYNYQYVGATLSITRASNAFKILPKAITLSVGDTITIGAEAESKLPLNFTLDNGTIATLIGNKIIGKNAGSGLVSVNQAQSLNYDSLATKTIPVTVNAAPSRNFGIIGSNKVPVGIVVIYSQPSVPGYTYSWTIIGTGFQIVPGTENTPNLQVVFSENATPAQVNSVVKDKDLNVVSNTRLDVNPLGSDEAKLVRDLEKVDCPPEVTDCKNSYITDVSIGKLKNTGTGCSRAGFGDYTVGLKIDSLLMGDSYDLSLGSVAEAGKSSFFAVWIDYNNNGKFTDQDDFLAASFENAKTFEIKNIIIKNQEEYEGPRRMRVSMRADAVISPTDPCAKTGGSGETEDYLVYIRKPDELQAASFVSPNKDGKNDNFIIRGINPKESNKLIIMDRYGSLVYEKENYANDWDGKNSKNNELTEGTYYYQFINGENEIKGFVEIKRK